MMANPQNDLRTIWSGSHILCGISELTRFALVARFVTQLALQFLHFALCFCHDGNRSKRRMLADRDLHQCGAGRQPMCFC